MVIPGNDDAIRAAQVVATAIADACIEGRRIAGAGLDEELPQTAEGESAAPGDDVEAIAGPEATVGATPGDQTKGEPPAAEEKTE